MRNVILGTIAGLALGTIGALAYSHFLGDGSLLASLQAQLEAANASLAKATQDKKQLAQETTGMSDQVDELVKSNEDLKHQLEDSKKAGDPAATQQQINPAMLAAMIMGMGRGGLQVQQRMFLLKTRLHLTQEQASAIQAAMQADATQRRELMRQMFRGGNGNGPGGPGGAGGNAGGTNAPPQTPANINTLDQTLATVLTPEQQTAYQQVQADENNSRADTMATTQMNQIAPLLQLSDTQKAQVIDNLYQVQMAAPDPSTLLTNPNAASVLTTQAQATQAALAKVLTTDQMALYQQEGQSLSNVGFGFGGRRGGNGGGGGGGNGAAGGGAAAGGTAAAATPAPAQ